jgi:hypothetical protein
MNKSGSVIMQKILACLICALALLAVFLPFTIASEIASATETIAENGSQESAPRTNVLRAGFEMIKPLNNLDVYGNMSPHNISFRTSSHSAFNISQRLGNVSKSTYNTDIYKPIYNMSQYSRTKPLYEVPDSMASKPVYRISGN